MEVEIRSIEIGERKRKLDNGKVRELVSSIVEIGLLQPVVIVRENEHYRLIAGRHRIEAYKELGRESIPAVEVRVDELDAELCEIDENLIRSDLSVLEQGELLLRRNEILVEKGQRKPAHGDGSNQYVSKSETISPLQKSTDAIASEIGLSERAAQQRIQIARDIVPEVKEAIKDTEIADSTSQLLQLARMEADKQREIIKEKDIEAALFLDSKKEKQSKGTLALLHTGDQESYTPEVYIEAAREVMGSIDTDPASNEKAQETVKAAAYYTAEDNGLTKEWQGNIYLNPPYSQPEIKQFINKLLTELTPGKQAILLTNNNTDTNWFYDAAEKAQYICFTKGRINFYKENGEITSPTNGQAFFYFGSKGDKFKEVFSKFGLIMKVV